MTAIQRTFDVYIPLHGFQWVGDDLEFAPGIHIRKLESASQGRRPSRVKTRYRAGILTRQYDGLGSRVYPLAKRFHHLHESTEGIDQLNLPWSPTISFEESR